MHSSLGFREPRRHASSRFSNRPGSVTLKKINYPVDEATFHEDDMPEKARKAREEIRRMIEFGSSTGAWTGSTKITDDVVPPRTFLRQLSEFQSLRFEYNFRAEELPQLFRTTHFVDVGNKFRLDRSTLLSKEEKGTLRKRNPTFQSRIELPVCSKLDGKEKWDASSELDRKKHKELQEEFDKKALEETKKKRDLLLSRRSKSSLERRKGCSEGGYRSLLVREKERVERMREEKRKERELAAIRAAKHY
eukprot:TRINITY_DN1652_c0_g1_i1.p1 TRINITY_DN1652_c0_g1~~TRINITY_DN1652_c0_g1_i1.p1  ORF type:complete len:249 (-),score=73.60 TRINITY_DN1652_c0_g1_i1:243-989(-)